MENSHEDICLMLGRLEGKVDGINLRLDKVNGSIKKHDDRINACETAIDQAKGGIKVGQIIWGAVITLISLAIAIFKK